MLLILKLIVIFWLVGCRRVGNMWMFVYDIVLLGGKYELGDIDVEGIVVSVLEKINIF